jgi:hypothetical protein
VLKLTVDGRGDAWRDGRLLLQNLGRVDKSGRRWRDVWRGGRWWWRLLRWLLLLLLLLLSGLLLL